VFITNTAIEIDRTSRRVSNLT